MAALRKLEELSEVVIRRARTYLQLVDILTVTEPSDLLLNVVISQIKSFRPMQKISDFITKLEKRRKARGKHAIEKRNKKIVSKWEKLLGVYATAD